MVNSKIGVYIMQIKCDKCGVVFNKKPSAIRKNNFCSKKCHYAFERGRLRPDRKTGIFKNCPICGNEFYVKKCHINLHKYCSKKCRYIGMTKGNKICPVCEKEFYAKGNPSRRIYCSRKCGDTARNTGKYVLCAVCGKEIYRTRGRLKNSKNYFCSSECANQWQGRTKISYLCKICGKEFKWSPSVAKRNPKYCSIGCRNKDPEWAINSYIKANIIQQNKKGPNKLELAGRAILVGLELQFNEQVLIANKFLVDVFIPKYNLIIQWDGDYWHGHEKYEKLDKRQQKRKIIDKSQNAYFKKCGYALLRFWESDVKKEAKEESDYIRRTIRQITK